jgi:hypothetical protein
MPFVFCPFVPVSLRSLGRNMGLFVERVSEKYGIVMQRNMWYTALGLWLLAASSANGQVLQGVMAVQGAEMQ